MSLIFPMIIKLNLPLPNSILKLYSYNLFNEVSVVPNLISGKIANYDLKLNWLIFMINF